MFKLLDRLLFVRRCRVTALATSSHTIAGTINLELSLDQLFAFICRFRLSHRIEFLARNYPSELLLFCVLPREMPKVRLKEIIVRLLLRPQELLRRHLLKLFLILEIFALPQALKVFLFASA